MDFILSDIDLGLVQGSLDLDWVACLPNVVLEQIASAVVSFCTSHLTSDVRMYVTRNKLLCVEISAENLKKSNQAAVQPLNVRNLQII